MNIVIRTDASAAGGAGHLMRCLALADALRRRDASVVFVTRATNQPWGALIRSHGHHVIQLQQEFPGWSEDLRQTEGALPVTESCDWLIVDHYQLGCEWESAMRAHARKILAIDDLGRHHDCDVLLDQNVMDDGRAYRERVPAKCMRLLGPRYAMLREEFAEVRQRTAQRNETCRRILINFGGSDPAGETDKAIRAFLAADIENARAQVILGAANANTAALRNRYGDHPRVDILDQSYHMAEAMFNADIAIGAGGISTWERASLGLPSVVIAIAENQAAIAADLASRGSHCYLGRSDQVDVASIAAGLRFLAQNAGLRASFSRTSSLLCDGQGTRRVTNQLLATSVLTLRRATAADSDALYSWRNAEEVRRHSLDPTPIARDDHQRWLARMLDDPDRHLLVGTDADGPVGVVRFDVVDDHAEVSIYLVPDRIGTGQGAGLLAAAHDWLRSNLPSLREVRARVLADNTRSAGLFEQAGYRPYDRGYRKPLNVAGDQA